MEENLQPSTELSLKDMGRLKVAIQGLSEGKTYVQIKDELGISRPTLYALMRKQGAQDMLKAEVDEIATEIKQIIQDLLATQNSANRRHALTELGKLHKQFNDKVTPNLTQSTSLHLNVNLDYEKLQQLEHIHTETISRLPPTHRTLYKQTYNQVTKEYTQ